MPPNATVCLIVKDRNRDDRHESDVDKQSRQWADELFREQGITSKQVTKIITKRQLEREYHTFNERRDLLTAYDVYLIDSRVHKSVLTFIGAQLHRSNKCAIAVHMDAPLLPQITAAFHKTSLDLSPFKTRISILVGHLAMNGDQLSANVDACLLALWRQCPGGGADNIHAIYLQPSNSSPSLPIYAHFGSANHVQVHKNVRSNTHNRRTLRRRAEIRDELSCLPDGLEVIVRPDGRVRVVNEKTKQTVVYPTVNDEVEPWDDLKPTKDPIVIERKRMRRKRQLVEKAKKRMKIDADDFKFEPLAVGSVVSVDD